MARKGALLQGFMIFGSYINIFIVFFAIDYIKALTATQTESATAFVTGLETGIGIYMSAFYSILIVYWAYSYFQIFKRAGALERQSVTLTDMKSIKKFEGVGIMPGKKLVKFSKLNIESCFRDRELVKLYKQLKEKISVKYNPKDIQENVTPGTQEEGDLMEYSMDFDEVDFVSYNLDYLVYKEMRSFFNDKELDFL
jgi:hypothetical protein